MQMAVRDSVTVSMAALMRGMLMGMFRVRTVDVSTSLGMIFDSEGITRRSSKVKPSFTWSSSMKYLQ